MRGNQPKRKLLAGLAALLLLVAGGTEAVPFSGAPGRTDWVGALWDGLGRLISSVDGVWGRSEEEPPTTQEPVPEASPESLGGYEEPPDDKGERSPVIDPDG